MTIPWPDGTGFFAVRTWVALAVGFYAAFFLQLQGASSAGVCVLILAQPAQGMVLSKAIYRIAGTLVGVVAALVITAMFPQDRTMLLATFAVWMACLTVCGSLLRDFRSYGCILSGYTVADHLDPKHRRAVGDVLVRGEPRRRDPGRRVRARHHEFLPRIGRGVEVADLEIARCHRGRPCLGRDGARRTAAADAVAMRRTERAPHAASGPDQLCHAGKAGWDVVARGAVAAPCSACSR